jgi:hypothetical protein
VRRVLSLLEKDVFPLHFLLKHVRWLAFENEYPFVEYDSVGKI